MVITIWYNESMKGRSTTCITIRLPDDVVKSLQDKAQKQGLSTSGEYIKAQILKGFRSESTIPIYNPDIHKVGDRVLIRQGKGLIEVIVPEIDAEGRPIPEWS